MTFLLTPLCLLTKVCHGARPLPLSQEDFFDLLPIEYPFPAPRPEIDPVAGRLMAACGSIESLAALAVAASQLHSFNVRADGSYDLTMPLFEADMDQTHVSSLLGTCVHLFERYAWMAATDFELKLWCAGGTCSPSQMQAVLSRSTAFCHAACDNKQGPMAWLTIQEVVARATSRMCRVVLAFCSAIGAAENDVASLARFARQAASEIHIFLDHAFHTLSFSPRGLPAIDPFSQLMEQGGVPAFEHVPVSGLRWDVLLHILSSFSEEERSKGLRVAEIGVEKGMTITYLLRNEQSISDYYAVDPWHVQGKSAESNDVLQSYFQNLESWALHEETFQRNGRRAVNIIRQHSDEAAGQIPSDYLDMVFIDADHTFEAVRRDIQVWRRRVRPGGILAGHDFSLFHPAVSLAVLVECGPMGDDNIRFPLQSDMGRPIIHLSVDSVWWVKRLPET